MESAGGYLNRVEFVRESANRPDTTKSYATKSLTQLSRRLHRIDIHQDGDLIRRYACTYELGPNSGRTRLKKLDTSAWKQAGAPEETLPSIVFTYNNGGGVTFSAGAASNLSSPGDVHFADVDGDGRKDLIALDDNIMRLFSAKSDGTYWFRRADFLPTTGSYSIMDWNSDGQSDLLVRAEAGSTYGEGLHVFGLACEFDYDHSEWNLVFNHLKTYQGIPEGDYRFADIDADGHQDVITITRSNWKHSSEGDNDDTNYYVTTVSSYRYDPATDTFTQVSSVGHSISFKDYALSTAFYPRVHFFDIDSDQRTDCLFNAGGRELLQPNEPIDYAFGMSTYGPTALYIAQADGSYSDQPDSFNFNGNHINIGDVNGDGLTDIVTDDDHDAWAYLADGNGDFVYQGQTIDIENHYGGKGLFDINGDGLADMVQTRTSSDRIQMFTSNGDGGFARLYPMEGGIIVAREDTEKWVDVSGDGLLDIVTYTYDEDGDINVTTYLAESDGKPDLLTGVDNGKGATVTLAYSEEDLTSSRPRPVTDTFVPFSLSLVTSRTVTDAFSAPDGITTSYHYDGGVYDPVERDFLGFATVTTTRPDNAQVVRSFHQDYYRKARVKQTDLMEGEDLKTRTVSTWTTSDLGAACSKVQLENRETTRYDGSETAQVVKAYTYHSDCGLPLTKIITDNSGHINGVGTVKTYINKGDWSWRLESESISDINGVLARKRHLLYDTQGNLVDDLALCRGDCSDPDLYDYLGDKWAHTHYEYGTRGNITSKTDPEGRVSSYPAYDAHNLYPVQIDYPDTEDPVTHEVTAHSEQIPEYDYRYGLPSETLDRNGTSTVTTYDGYGRPLSVVTRDSASVLLSTDAYYYQDYPDFTAQRPAYTEHTISEDLDGDLNQRTYIDGLGRSLQTSGQWEGGTYRTTRQFFDVMGRVERTEGPYLLGAIGYDDSTPTDSNPYTVAQYDTLGRATNVTTLVSSAQTAVTGYVYEGFATETTDPDGNKRRVEKDGLGRTAIVVEYLDGEQVTTRYSYTSAGDLTSVLKATDAAGFSENEAPTVTWTMTYNTLGLKLSMDDPDMGVWEYAYAADGQLATQTGAEGGKTVNFAYDELGRLSEKTYESGAPTIQYRYDRAVNGIGRLYSVVDENGSVLRGVDAYDGLGREKTTRAQISGDSARLTTFGYDLAGQLRTIAYPATGGYTVTYDYHPNSGLLASVSDDDGQLASFDDYTAQGRLGGIDFINGVDTQYDYHPGAGRLDTLRTTAASGLIVDKAYTYTPAGDIETLTDGSVTYTYTYDSLHRLTGESDNTSTVPVRPMVIDFFYDDAGPLHAPSDITLNGQPRMVMYDENGNTTSLADMTDPASAAERTITYTDDNMPASVTHSTKGTTSFLYDGDGQRAKKSGAGGSTFYVSNLFEVIGGVETSYVFASGLRIAKVTATEKQFLHADHLGSTVAVTTEAGTRLEGKAYVPYGLTRGAEDIGGTGYQFTDQELDGSTGLYNYDARLYDPVIGRFLSADSIVPHPFDPQSYNRYSYVLNNPLIYTDPTGHTNYSDFGTHNNYGNDLYDDGSNTSEHVDEKEVDNNQRQAYLEKAHDYYFSGEVSSIREGRFKAVSEDVLSAKTASIIAFGVFRVRVPKKILETPNRLPQDMAVNPTPPRPLPTNRPIGSSPTQNQAAQAEVRRLQNAGYTDIRIDQQQVNAAGQRVGINRPDIQATSPSGQRTYIEYDTSISNRGPIHQQRITANDPTGRVILRTVD